MLRMQSRSPEHPTPLRNRLGQVLLLIVACCLVGSPALASAGAADNPPTEQAQSVGPLDLYVGDGCCVFGHGCVHCGGGCCAPAATLPSVTIDSTVNFHFVARSTPPDDPPVQEPPADLLRPPIQLD
jgi:hypothetical protein